jgi:hypothetical protein
LLLLYLSIEALAKYYFFILNQFRMINKNEFSVQIVLLDKTEIFIIIHIEIYINALLYSHARIRLYSHMNTHVIAHAHVVATYFGCN